MAGLDPRFFTTAELWHIAEARRRSLRDHAIDQAALVWADFEKLDIDRYRRFGAMTEPLSIDDMISPQLEALIQEEERKMAEAKRARDGNAK